MKYTGCLKKRPLRIFRKDWMIFQNCFRILLLVVYFSIKKEISILSHIEKSYRPGNFRKTACPKKHLVLNIFLKYILSYA